MHRVSLIVFFFSSRRRHTRCSRDWSSDVCSSDLTVSRAGFTATDATGGRTTDTVEVSARFALVAMTLNVPAVWPAVYRPFVVIVPPVAANVALTGAEELSLYLPDTENCLVLPTLTVAVSGASVMRTSV